jgi:hypothetical protein
MVVGLVVVAVAGIAVAGRSKGAAAPGAPTLTPGASVSAPNAESSAWYCTGESTASGQLAQGSVVLTNTSTKAVTGSIAAVTDSGATSAAPVSVPARGQVVADVPAPASGSWLSQVVLLSGGGVAVSQTVHGPNGWSEAPCQSGTSQQWYFASGLTSGSNALFVALFNPTSTADVVDMSFVTPAGIMHPINFQGIVLQPNETQVENVGAFVQNQSRIATTVSTRTGRVVASELQVLSGNGNGLAIVPGAPRAEKEWSIPQSLEVAGGTSSIDIYNPGSTTERVTVQGRLLTGTLAPFVNTVAPDSTWAISTSTQTRIPKVDAYSTIVTASGGDGVVVSRNVAAPSTAQAPQAGFAGAVDGLSAASPSRLWAVPSPGTAAQPALPGVQPDHLALTNTTSHRETYVVYVMTAKATRTIASGTLRPFGFISLGAATLFGAGLNPLLVRSSGDVAISEDIGPAGTYGVVTMTGLPLSASLAG